MLRHMNSIEKYLQSKGLSKATVKCYSSEIMEFIVWCDMQNIAPEATGSTDVTAYLQHLQRKGQQNTTRSINLGILKHYYDYQISTGKRENNPAGNIKIRGTGSRKLYPIFSRQELESLYCSYTTLAEDNSNNNRNWFKKAALSRQRNKAILSLMINQGLCTDEVNRLTTADIKLKEGTIRIAGTRKSNERTLELKSHQIIEQMEYQFSTRKELLLLHPGIKDTHLYFIPSPNVAGITGKSGNSLNIWKRLTEELKKNNKKLINFQQIRASVITHWLGQYNLREVQYMAGHRYIGSTESYLINQIDDLQSDIDRYHPIG